MTGQMKQRIVGIGVLVFLALIVLPWLFTGNQPPVVEQKKVTTAPLPDMTSQQVKYPSYYDTEDLAPSRPTPHPTPIQQHAEKKPTPDFEMNAAKINNIETAIIHTTAPEHAARKITPPVVIKDDEGSDKPTKAVEKKQTTKKSEKNWTIQLGSFNNKDNATKLVQQLKNKGYPVYSKTSTNSKGQVITRVFVGPQGDHQQAERMVNQINKLAKIHGVIVKANV